MRVIGYKKQGLGLLYGFVIAFFCIGMVALMMSGSMEADASIGFFFAGIIVIVSVIIMIKYFSVPKEIIKLTNQQEIEITNGVVIPLVQITNVRYHRATARGIQYKYGTVYISAWGTEFACKFVAECESVAYEILELKNQAVRNMEMARMYNMQNYNN